MRIKLMTVETPGEIREAIYKYTADGWHVFPVCWFDGNNKCSCGYRSRDGKPHEENNIGKAPFLPHGLKDATTTRAGVDNFMR